MSDNAPSSKTKSVRRGFISIILFGVFKVLLLCLAAWVLLLLWFSVQWVFSEQDTVLSQAQHIVNVNTCFITDTPLNIGQQVIHQLQQCNQFVNSLFATVCWLQVHSLQPAVTLVLYCSEIVLTRLVSYLVGLPLLMVISFIGITDGLVSRDLRKFTGARESTLLFHRLKHLLGFVFFVPLFFYFCIPVAFSPLWFLLPHLVLLGITVRLTLTYFKKYV